MKPLLSVDALRASARPVPAPARLERGGAGRGKQGASGLEPTIYRFIIRHSLKQQIFVLLLTLVSFPFLYYSLDLPKTIINQAIGGRDFPKEVLGFSFEQIPYLMLLCGIFLALVFINGGFKYFINVYKGRLGERMLRRLRYELYHRIIRFPLPHFKRISAGETIPMITSEVEPLGGFIGDAFALPAYQGGTLLTILIFMFVQDAVLGAAAIALYPAQAYVIPKLQRKVNQLGKQRVRTVRVLADKVGESMAGITEIRANDTARLYLANFANYLGTIYDLRFEIYRRKFFIKFLNNFIAQLTPFFFFSIGGYLVIRGQLTFGALVAVLAAYKDLSSPWKELLDFYQLKEDARIKYEQVIEQFQPEGLIDEDRQLVEPDSIPALSGEVALVNVSLVEDERVRLLDGVTAHFAADRHVAIVGQSGSGKDELVRVLAGLIAPSSGRVTIGGHDLATLPSAVLGRRIAYVGANAHLFAGSLRDNLFLGLKHQPLATPEVPAPRRKKRELALFEARQAGNIDLDIEADWIDYAAAGVEDMHGLITRAVEILRLTDLEEEVYGLGLRGRLDATANPAVAEGFLKARAELRRRLEQEGMTHLVEAFHPERYNTNASLAENLLFGTPVGPAFAFDGLAQNTYVLSVLDKTGLTQDLIAVGQKVAETMIELFADLPPDHEFWEQFSFIGPDDLPEFQAILAKSGREALAPEDRTRLMSLPFKLILARHRLDLIDEAMQARLVDARGVFCRDLPEALKGAVEFFDPTRYNGAATLQDNILFGKIAYGEAEAPTRIRNLMKEVLDALNLREPAIVVGLDFQVGSGGQRLGAAQRQKAALAAAVLKRPDILVLNEATAACDGQAQGRLLTALKQEFAGRGIVWSLHRAGLARHFDHVMVMSGGRLVEQGGFAELDRPDTLLKILALAD